MAVRWTDAAYADLENIYLYIAEDNPNAAARIVDHIEAWTKSLRDRICQLVGSLTERIRLRFVDGLVSELW